VTRARWAAVVIVGLALIFAFEAGEYSTLDWWQVRRQERQEQAIVTALQKTVDSLTTVLHLVETDPATQERIAREQYGMLRKGEFLYRIVPAPEDSEREQGAGSRERR
jgi:cell division protein FtsB